MPESLESTVCVRIINSFTENISISVDLKRPKSTFLHVYQLNGLRAQIIMSLMPKTEDLLTGGDSEGIKRTSFYVVNKINECIVSISIDSEKVL